MNLIDKSQNCLVFPGGYKNNFVFKHCFNMDFDGIQKKRV